MQLRPYQATLENDVFTAWDKGHKNVLAVSPTGSGKTVLFSEIIKKHQGASCAIAHRQELVTQISLALARDGVRHRIIGPKNVVKLAVSIHMQECGASYYDPSSQCAVAGVDTLVRRNGTGFNGDYYYQIISENEYLIFGPRKLGKWGEGCPVTTMPKNSLNGLKRPVDMDITISNWCNQVTKWIQDEAHHLLTNNKWGKAVDMFPNAIGLGVTATPIRADGYGLGRHHDGVFDTMVEGPQMRALINMGYLTDYRVFAPKTEDLNLEDVTVSKVTGDYNPQKLKKAIRKSKVVGDVVKHYLRIASGKLGITFADSVETATEIAAEFNRCGVPAEVVSAKTPNAERVLILRRFKARKLLQLVNVDLFGEGFDLPAIEVVSMARPTKSFSLYTQQFGRALRLMISEMLSGGWGTYTDAQRIRFIAESTKPHAIIIDHVGNIDTAQGGHGLPDAPKIWTLDRRERRSKSKVDDDIPTTTCPACTAVYERITSICPFCGHKAEPAARSGPEFVDGDLTELDPATLARMRGEIEKVDLNIVDARIEMENKYMPEIGIRAGLKRHVTRQETQKALRASIAWWAGFQRNNGFKDSESYRRFYFKFGVDVLTAQSLNTQDASALSNKINYELSRLA